METIQSLKSNVIKRYIPVIFILRNPYLSYAFLTWNYGLVEKFEIIRDLLGCYMFIYLYNFILYVVKLEIKKKCLYDE